MFKFLRASKAKAADAAAPAPSATAATAATVGGDSPALPPRADADTLLRRLEWTVVRRLDGLLQGDYRTLLRGFGLDLADLREYQAHDDVRYIDWNVTARLQVPHVREFQEDREVSAWFVMDLSGSVDFGSEQMRKRELATALAGVLARVLTRHGNRVGGILQGRSNAKGAREEVLPARGGRRQVLHLMDRIGVMQGEPVQPGGAPTDLGAFLRRADQVIKRRSVVFVVSDFISTPGWEKPLGLLARRHEVVAVRLYDPMERELPALGLIVMQDAETGEQIFVDTHDAGFRRRFAQQAQAREENLREALASAGVDCLELSTAEDLPQSLLRFIDLRKRRSRLSGGASMGAGRLAELHG